MPTELSNLEKLSVGLLNLSLEKENKDLAYKAMNRQSKAHAYLDRKGEYAREIKRVLTEIKLTNYLLEATVAELNTPDIIYYPEDIVLYYEGIFLDQAHQLKDKLIQLVLLLLNSDVPKNPREESTKKLTKKIETNAETLRAAGVYDLLSEWKEESGSDIGVVLERRQHHHHKVSKLGYDMNLQRARMSRLVLNPNSRQGLSDYGIAKLEEIGKESYKKWRDEVVDKQRKTIQIIERNIEAVIGNLIAHLEIPTDVATLGMSINSMLDSEKKLEIINNTSLEKINPLIKDILDKTLHYLKELGDDVVSVYLVGSSARGDFNPAASDVNLVIISSDRINVAVDPPIPLVDTKVISQTDFLEDANKKIRFICYSDGLLVLGNPQSFNKDEFPKPGTFLSLLLNSDFESEIEKIRVQVEKLDPDKDKLALCAYSKKLAKIMVNFIYGVAIGNNPSYTCNMKSKIDYIKNEFPGYIMMINMLEQIYLQACLDKASFPVLIDKFYIEAKKNYQKMLAIQQEVAKEEKVDTK